MVMRTERRRAELGRHTVLLRPPWPAAGHRTLDLLAKTLEGFVLRLRRLRFGFRALAGSLGSGLIFGSIRHRTSFPTCQGQSTQPLRLEAGRRKSDNPPKFPNSNYIKFRLH